MARTPKLLAMLAAVALIATSPLGARTLRAQTTKAPGGGGAKSLEQVTNPAGNVDVNRVMNPAVVKDLEALMKPSAVKTPDQLANPDAVKSLDEVTKDATQDVDDITQPSGDD